MCAVGDMVVYGTDGVCRITDIAEHRFGKTVAEYYVLTPAASEDAVIYVPTGNAALKNKMRRLLSKEEILALLHEFRYAEEPYWETNEQLRRKQFREMLLSGDRRQLLTLIRTIHFQEERQKKAGRKLHYADEQMLKDAQELLHDELQYVIGLEQEDVLPFIVAEIEGR